MMTGLTFQPKTRIAANTRKQRVLSRALLAGLLAATVPATTVFVSPAAAQATQNSGMTERAERIVKSLRPAAQSRYSDAAYTNRIIQMEIPLPRQNGSKTIVLNYNHSIDLAVYYNFDSSKITRETAEVLDDLGYALQASELSGSQFLVAGHTDASGSDSYNQWLSERRALSAKRYLVENFRINPERLIVVGFGETRLADERRPRDGINRRVEITLIEDAYRGPTAERLTAPRSTYQGGEVATPEELGLVEYGSRPAPVTDCDGTQNIRDNRPANTGLDDFGNRPTPVPCGDPAQADDAAAAPAAPQPAPAPPASSNATPVVPAPANPASGQNSAITN